MSDVATWVSLTHRRPVPAQRLRQTNALLMICCPNWSIPTVDEEPHILAMACLGDIGQMPIHGAGCQDVRLIDRRTLGLVDGNCITMIEAAEFSGVETHKPIFVSIKRNSDLAILRRLNCAQHPVFDTDVFIISGEDDPVFFGECAFARFG